jgi:hypothetical protein
MPSALKWRDPIRITLLACQVVLDKFALSSIRAVVQEIPFFKRWVRVLATSRSFASKDGMWFAICFSGMEEPASGNGRRATVDEKMSRLTSRKERNRERS